MPSDTKRAIEEINELSRQLLSRIITAQEKAEDSTTSIDTTPIEGEEPKPEDSIVDKALAKLMSVRDELIRDLFAQSKTDELEQELNLLNEMASLDSELLAKSQACKNALTKQVIKLKKGEKASRSYQGY